MLNLTDIELEYVRSIFRNRLSSLDIKLYRIEKGISNQEAHTKDIEEERGLVAKIHEKLKKL